MTEEMKNELINAVLINSFKDVERLLNSGTDINMIDDHENLLMIMIRHGNINIDMMKFLINRGININFEGLLEGTDNKANIIFYLIYYNDYDDNIPINVQNILSLFINSGCNINYQNNYGMDALMFASSNELLGFVKLLLNYGANTKHIDNQGNSVIRYLIEYYSKVRYYLNIKNKLEKKFLLDNIYNLIIRIISNNINDENKRKYDEEDEDISILMNKHVRFDDDDEILDFGKKKKKSLKKKKKSLKKKYF